MDAGTLYNAIAAAGCPVISTRIVDQNDRTTWSFVPDASATSTQIAAGSNVIATIDPVVKNVIPFDQFIQRWLDAEYTLLMQRRATAITNGNITLVKQWDTALAAGKVDLNSPAAINFKNNMVSAGILTQARADVIFS